ncbi:MAG: lytic transglycosylase domain-containing protein, partial [Muribaculaceae bacterium]|nr:lytic transglycosylase domain-containing protein [Muribaculaceae bacterium]
MMKRFCLISLTLLALGAQAKNNDNILSHTITDEAIVYPESFESDTQKLLESWYMKNYTATDRNYATHEDPKVSDAEMQRRLAALPCIIEMPYNQIVRSYIDRYTKKGRAQVAAILGLGLYYTPIFEQALEAEGLPLELKYLPVIESGLNPNAVSRHGATGLWQFMLGPAKGLGMEVNSLVDERRDPYTSSRYAAKFLKDLYATYGDWSLVIAAYNCGPGTVNKAIRRAGGDPKSHDFWSIYYYLPAETRGYVPMFIAANYVMNYYRDHYISPVLPTKPLITDTLGINTRVHFDQISHVLNIPKDELRLLNPQFRADVIPGTAEKGYALILPSQQVHAYLVSEPQILSYEADKYKRQLVATPGGDPSGADAVAEEGYELAETSGSQEVLPSSISNTVTAVASNAVASATGKKRQLVHTVASGESINDIARHLYLYVAEIHQ